MQLGYPKNLEWKINKSEMLAHGVYSCFCLGSTA